MNINKEDLALITLQELICCKYQLLFLGVDKNISVRYNVWNHLTMCNK